MKRSFWQHTLATLALVVALPAAVFAQPNPTVVNDNNVAIADGAAPADYLLTEFPDTEVGTTSTAFFTVFNHGDADLTVGFITGSAEFVVLDQPVAAPNDAPAVVAAGTGVDIEVGFVPSGAGPFTAALDILTNAPDDEATYTLNLSGNGVVIVDPQANISIAWAEKKGVVKPLKVKLDKKTGQYKVSGQAVVTNTGAVEVTLADVEAWFSTDNILDETTDTALGSLKSLKKIKVAKTPKPGKPIKYKSKKAKVKVLAPAANGFIFLKAKITTPAGETELTQLDNVISIGYPVP